MPPPPPPPPPPAPPPAPSGGVGPPSGFKIVPGLGDALHEMKRKLTGHEETPAASEGVASQKDKCLMPNGKPRPKSWYGSQVPGKPRRDNDFINEMQSKLSKRKDKVDAESYVVETPDHLVVESLPPSGARRETPPTDYSPFMQRRSSKDSGRFSMTPSCDGEPNRRFSMDFNQYRRVSVDLERKEELILAKQVRKSSAKILRASPCSWEQNVESPSKSKEDSPSEPPPNVPEASPVVMRYWKQCSGAENDGNEVDDEDDNDQGQSAEPSWKTEALEGDITEFPSIRDKIANMEDAGKSVGQFLVPDVKSKMRQGPPPTASWMEARSKLQTQLDSLIAKTSAKMTKYGTVHAIEPRESKAKEESPSAPIEGGSEPRKKQPISPALTSLIKSVANEIQKSFSSKSLANCENDEEEGDEEERKSDLCDENNNDVEDCEYWRNDKSSKQVQPHIDMEAPIDFDYDEPLIEKCDPEVLEEDNLVEDKEDKPDESIEEPDEKDGSTPMVLDASLARSKAKLMRRTDRRLPAHVLAKRKAAEKLRETEQLSVMEQIQKELTDASQQVDLNSHEQDLENLNDEEKVDLIAKHISKMESEYVMKLLKQLESGILDISVPMLLPFLSLQVKLDLGRNIFRTLEPQNKERVVKENFINDMISDITDIALLQEVIDRTQEKINFLCPQKPTSTISGDYFNIEDDSYELPSTTLNIENDSYELPSNPETTVRNHPVLNDVLSHIEKLMKEGNKKEEDKTEVQKETRKENEKFDNPETKTTSSNDQGLGKAEEAEHIDDSKSSDESDEGLPSSECASSVVDDNTEHKEEKKVVENIKEKECENMKEIEERDDIEENKVDTKLKESKESKLPSETESVTKNMETTETTVKQKENNETVIKQKLRNILNNCKTNEQTRPTRNFGRNFEFQNIELKPVLPNDKRTPKARRMDDMWMNTIASKQKWPCNNQLAAPKPKVPWTMNKNTQPQKKDENTEVKEFDKCHKNIKEVESNQISTVKKVIQKSSVVSNDGNRGDGKVKINEEIKKESNAPHTLDIPLETEEIKTENTKEIVVTENKSVETHTEVKRRIDSEERNVTVEEKQAAEVKKELKKETNNSVTTIKETSKYKQPRIDTEAPIDFDNLDTSHLQKDTLEVPKTKEKSTKIENPIKEKEEKTLKTSDKSVESESSKDTVGVPVTPTVRRRGDTFTVVIPLREKPPPPPMAKPPPPPMSPPVPATRVQELEKEDKIGKVDKKIELESEESEEEESEWEWTEEEEESEEEEEEGNTYEVNKEGWENILSSSKGPTTFKAEYSIKVGVK